MPTRKPLTAPYIRHVEALGLLVRLDLDGTLRVRPFGSKQGWATTISLKDIHNVPESPS